MRRVDKRSRNLQNESASPHSGTIHLD
jgi:hypothetical protein